MTQILFIQGAGTDVHDEWDYKLVESLKRELGSGFEIRYPLMPDEANPTLASWQPVLENELASLRDGDIVVGHSIGGTLLINVLADSSLPIALGAIVLISSPFIGAGGWDSDEITPKADLEARLPSGVPVLLYHGDSDEEVPLTHASGYERVLPRARLRLLAGRDHQLNNDLAVVAQDIRTLGAERAV